MSLLSWSLIAIFLIVSILAFIYYKKLKKREKDTHSTNYTLW